MPMAPDTKTPELAPSRLRPDDDGREMCFSQGKPCVYESETDENTIITEWPNGVIEHMDVRTRMVTRTWPDGETDTFSASSPENRRYPYVK